MTSPRSQWSLPVLVLLAVIPMTRCQCPNTNTPPEGTSSSGGASGGGSSGQVGASSGMVGTSSGVVGTSSGVVGASSGVAGASSGVIGGASSGWIIDADGGVVVLVDGGIVIRDDGGVFLCIPVLCDSHIAECGDCRDNDGDGRTDFRDVECLGPCDNTEGSTLNGGVGGETGGPCRADCYFDWGNGPGNDDCHWDHRCDPLAVAPNFPPEGASCAFQANRVGSSDCPDTQSQQCHNSCRPLTPNGCDCFGCCTFPVLAGRGADGGQGYVWLGAMNGTTPTCTFAGIADQALCPPCTPVGDCFNDCGICEVCVGRPEPDPSCPTYRPDAGVVGVSSSSSGTPGSSSVGGGSSASAVGGSSSAGGVSGTSAAPSSGGGSTSSSGGVNLQCPGGEQPCGLPGQADCAPPNYCITGCCQMVGG